MVKSIKSFVYAETGSSIGILNLQKSMEKKNQNEELQSRREFFKKAAKGALPILAFNIFGASFFSSCDSDSDSGSDELNSVPASLKKGYVVRLHKTSGRNFEFYEFRTLGDGKGQWASTETHIVSLVQSDATYTYVLKNGNTATLKSVNYCSYLSRSYTITLDLSYTSYNSGSYKMKAIRNDTGLEVTSEGTFTIVITTSNGGNCSECSNGCSSSCGNNCTGKCTKSCADNCSQNCTTTCRTQCVNTCSMGCTGTCYGVCTHITKY